MEQQPKKRRPSTATVKKSAQHGVITQKMMSFKVDIDILSRLNHEQNKGRLINELLRKHYKLTAD